jgi:hypothetical protein
MTTPDEYEAALRRLPEAHSLALRLREVGVADDVICGYLRIEPSSDGRRRAGRSRHRRAR